MPANEKPLDDPLLTPVEAGLIVNYKPRTLEDWRQRGCGPKYVAISKRSVRYRRSDLVDWIESRIRTSTSDPGIPPTSAEAARP